jgi:ACS family glucarate transporter-like MFS transporter
MRDRGKANGIIFGGIGVGSGLTPPIVTAIVVHYGWRASFWFSAVVGLVAGTVWYLLARDTPEQHPLVRDSELALILKERDPAPRYHLIEQPIPHRKALCPLGPNLQQ